MSTSSQPAVGSETEQMTSCVGFFLSFSCLARSTLSTKIHFRVGVGWLASVLEWS